MDHLDNKQLYAFIQQWIIELRKRKMEMLQIPEFNQNEQAIMQRFQKLDIAQDILYDYIELAELQDTEEDINNEA